MPIYRRALLALLALSTLALPLPAAATSPQACLDDLAKYPPFEVAQGYAARLKTEKLPREAAFWSQYCVGRAWFSAGDFKKALPPLREAARLAKSAQERSGAQSLLGSTLSSMNRLDEAETAHQASLAAAREQGNAIGQAMELSNLGTIAAKRQQYDTALGLYTRSLTLQPDEREKTVVLNNMGDVYAEMNNRALAAEVLQQAIAIDRRLGNQQSLARHLLNLGNIYLRMQQWKDCGAALDEGLALARANGDRYWEGTGLMFHGWASRDDKQPVKAREYLTDALKIFREIGAAGDVAQVEADLRELK